MRRLIIISAVVLSMVVIWGVSWKEENWAGQTMGTSYNVHIFRPGFLQGGSKIPSAAELQQLLEDDLHRINQSMSTYIKDSEISKFNRFKADNVCHPVSEDFMQVLTIAQQINKDTNGYFDATVGPLVDLWGFGGKSEFTLNWQPPSEDAIASALKKVGFNALEINSDKRCIVKTADTEIDFSAVAKGYGVDVLVQSLQKSGIENALVEIGGEVHVIGQKMPLRPWTDTSSWKVKIDMPAKEMDSAPVMTDNLKKVINAPFNLKDQAVATSGNYRNFYEYQGQSYSHIINPKTGYPLECDPDKPQLVSVSIFNLSTGVADGYATGLYVLGLEAAKAAAIRYGFEVVLVYEDKAAKALDVWVSPAFTKNKF